MGIFDNLFGSKKKLGREILQEPYQIKGRKDIFEAAKPGALERLKRSGTTYPGQQIAGLSEFELQGLGTLGDYLESDMPTEGELFQAGKGELLKTLQGGYDPGESDYYKAFEKHKLRLLQEAKDRLAATTSARDKYFGGGRIATEGEMEEDVITDLGVFLGSLMERERERKLGAVGPAMEMTSYEELAPLGRVEASQTFGALPRQLEQAGLSAEYAEWVRALEDLGIPLDAALGLATYKPEYTYPLYAYQPGLMGGKEGIGYGGQGTSQGQQAGSILQILARLGSAGGTK